MFSTISWSQYFFYLLVLVVIYYLVVWIVFFKAKLPLFNSIRDLSGVNRFAEDHPDEVLSTTQHIIDEIRPLFTGRPNKNELMLALQLHLKKYNQWDEPGFREGINEFINYESQSKCSIPFSEDDLRVVWL